MIHATRSLIACPNIKHKESATQLLTLEADDKYEQGVAIQEFLSARAEVPHPMSPLGIPDYALAETHKRPVNSTGIHDLSSSIRDLLGHSNQALASAIAYERATTIAAFLSAIPGDRAAGILKLLTVEMRTRVLAILDAGVDANPKVIEAVAEWICDHLADSSMEPTVGLRHRSALKAILDEFSAEERTAMLEDLANENPMLARRLAEETSATVEQPRDCYC